MHVIKISLLIATLTVSNTLFASESVQTASAWNNDCEKPGLYGSPALVAIFAPIIISAVVDHAAASLKAASESKAMQFSTTAQAVPLYEATGDGDLIPVSNFDCLTIIRGKYEGKNLKGEPYFKLKLKRTDIEKTGFFSLVPTYFQANKMESGSWLSSTGDYNISVSLYSLGSTTPWGSATFHFENIKEGTEITAEDQRLISNASDPIKYPEDLEDAKGVQAKRSKAAAPYLIALGVLKRSVKPSSVADNAKPDQYDTAKVDAALKMYCAEETTYNRRLPAKVQSFSEVCAIEKNSKKRRLDEAVAAVDAAPEVLSWARKICADWNSKDDCNKTFTQNAKKRVTTGYYLTKATLTETRKENSYGMKLAVALGAATDEIKKELNSKLPEAKKQAGKAEDAADRKSQYEYEKAKLKYDAALADFNSADSATKLQARIDLIEACYLANEAAITAKQPVVCPRYL